MRTKIARLLPVLLSDAADDAHTAYKSTVLGVQSANLIAYWPLDELTGTTADNAEGTAARDGTYTGVTLDNTTGPFGGPAGLWDGVNDLLALYSANLAGVFDGSELSMSVWFKVPDWSAIGYKYLWRMGASETNYLHFVKPNNTNVFRTQYLAGGTNDFYDHSSFSPTGWFHAVATISSSNDRMRIYIDGSQVGSDQTGLGTYSGTLSADWCKVANYGALYWSGNVAHPAVWSTELTAANVTTLYNEGPS